MEDISLGDFVTKSLTYKQKDNDNNNDNKNDKDNPETCDLWDIDYHSDNWESDIWLWQ